MTNEELLQKTLNVTVDRLGKQAVYYEAEVAKLNSQILILNEKIEELTNTTEVKTKTATKE